MKHWLNIGKHLTAALMLLLFCGYYVDVNCFVHSHIINGVTIVHSHFHTPSHHDSQSGGHTTTELTLITNMATQFLTTGKVIQPELAVYNILILILGVEQDTQVESIHISCPSLRAPPAHIG